MPSKKLPYTKKEFDRFDYLTDKCCSRNQMQRIEGRLALTKFIDTHGLEKCNLMWAEIKRKGL
jgi:hypothetical protein